MFYICSFQSQHCIHQSYYSKTDIHTMGLSLIIIINNNNMLETYSVAFSIYIPLLASGKTTQKKKSLISCVTCFILKPNFCFFFPLKTLWRYS